MKLKYILPVTAIAGVATVVTPLATSCGNKLSPIIKWKAGEELELTGIPKAPDTVVFDTHDKCNESFAQFSKNDIRTYTEGVALYLLEGHADYLKNPEHSYQDITEFEIEVTDIDSTLNARQDVTEEIKDEPTKSFKISIKGTMSAWFKPVGDEKIDFKGCSFEAKNIPVYFHVGGSECMVERPYRDLGGEQYAGWWVSNSDWSLNMPEVTVNSQGKFVVGANKTFNKSSPVPVGPEQVSSFVALQVLQNICTCESIPYWFASVKVNK